MSAVKAGRALTLPIRSPRAPRGSGGGWARLWSEFTDPGPAGDAPVFLKKYGAALGPAGMGIPFLTVGLLVMFLVGRKIDLADKRTLLPLLFGAIFALAGIFVTTFGIKMMLGMAAAPAPRDGAPWTSDNDWDSSGATPDNPGGGFGTAVGRLIFLVFIGFLNILWTVKMTGSGRLIVALVVGLFDLLALLVVYDTLRKMVQAIRVGTPRLAWRTFPFFTGGRFEAVFQTSRPMRPNGPPKVTLRRIEQHSGGSQSVQSFEAWSSEQALTAFAEGTMTSFPVQVDVPADQPGTDLSNAECTYWQLLVTVPVAGPDVEAVFLLPIYQRPA